jgi:hypothetical protein
LTCVNFIISKGDTAEDIANNLADALNAAPNVTKYFDNFSASQIGAGGSYLVEGQNAPGNTTPASSNRSYNAGNANKSSYSGVQISVAIDPFGGTADFEITGTALGGGDVMLGIDGLTASTPTTAGESDETIMQALMQQLYNDGLTDDVEDDASTFTGDPSDTTTDAEFTELDIDTGDPVDSSTDIGAWIESDDLGLEVDYDVNVPEPGTMSLLGLGFAAVAAMRRRPGKRAVA